MRDLGDYNLQTEDLPLWMRPKKRRFDMAFLVVFVIGLILFMPMLINQGVPANYAAQAEMYRIQAVSDSLLDGQAYPRWLWQFNQGTGSPVLNYIAPAPQFLGGLIQTLTGSSAPAALRYFILLGTLWGTLSTLAFVRRRWTISAGSMAALLYLTSPWVLTISPYWEMDSGLILASALLPFNLWILDRLLDDGAGLDYTLFGLGLAGLLLSENGLGVVLAGFILIWLSYLILLEHKTTHLRLIAGAMVFGVMISLVFYIPSLNQLEQIEWLAAPEQVDLETQHFYDGAWDSQIENAPSPSYYLGIGASLVALLACGWWVGISISTKQKFPIQYFWGVWWIGLAALMLSENRIIWSPWRNIEPLTTSDFFPLFNFCTVVLVALTLQAIDNHLHISNSRYVVGIVGVAILVTNLSYFSLPDFTHESVDSLEQYADWEKESGWLNTLPNGQFADASHLFSEDLDAVPLLGLATVYPENSILEVESNTYSREFHVYTPTDNRLYFYGHDYQGLRLEIGDKERSLTRQSYSNPLSTAIPEGNHTVRFEFRNTTFHWLSSGISALALGLLILIGYGLENNSSKS